MELLDRAKALTSKLLEDRRYLHQHPEVGINLPGTCQYVAARLTEMGYAPRECGGGIVADLGRQAGPTILLRSDMDALPVTEENDLPFRSENGRMHACGHDLHMAMLLGAAQLLREREAELAGRVRLMFQPDEESMTGARAMLDAGVLEGVDAAFALHVFPDRATGLLSVSTGAMMASQDRFRITVTGVGGHGALPWLAVDPIYAANQIYTSLQSIQTREVSALEPVVITVGLFQGGTAANVLPETTVMEGTIRTLSPETRALVKRRVGELARETAAAHRAAATVKYMIGTPPLINDAAFAGQAIGFLGELGVPTLSVPPLMGSEDFARVTERVPGAMFFLGAGGDEAVYREAYNHNPRVRFNEEALPVGTAVLTHCALRWLEQRLE